MVSLITLLEDLFHSVVFKEKHMTVILLAEIR